MEDWNFYLENGKASSRAKAYAILVFASIAEQPVKNWISITQNHITVPPLRPPAFRNICAAGRPVGVASIPSKSCMQKQNVIVSIQPMRPDTSTARRIATGPRIAASCVSSDMLQPISAWFNFSLVSSLLGGAIIVSHGPRDGEESMSN